MGKREFSWDSEELIGTIQDGSKVKHEVKICTLSNTEYLVVTKHVLKRDGWSIVRNQTFKMDVFSQLIELVASHLNMEVSNKVSEWKRLLDRAKERSTESEKDVE